MPPRIRPIYSGDASTCAFLLQVRPAQDEPRSLPAEKAQTWREIQYTLSGPVLLVFVLLARCVWMFVVRRVRRVNHGSGGPFFNVQDFTSIMTDTGDTL